MAVSRKRAKLQPELLSPHAPAPAGDLSSVMIRARSRAKAALPLVGLADPLPSADRGMADAGESDTHTSDGLLFRKGAATGSSFRPDYWTFDRPEPKPEAPSEPLLAKRGTAPTPHKPQPQARAKTDLSPKALQEQIAALQALITSGGPEEEAEPPISADGQHEPPPPASLLEAMQPAASAAPEPVRSRITGAIEGPAEPLIPPPLFAETEALAAPVAEPAPSTSLIPPPLFTEGEAHEPATTAPLDAPAATPIIEIAADFAPPAELPTPEPVAEAEAFDAVPPPALEQPELAPVAEIAAERTPAAEPAPDPVAEVEIIPPSSLDPPAATPAVELVAAAEVTPEPMPALFLDMPVAEPAVLAEAMPQPEPLVDELMVPPEPAIDAPSAEVVIETVVIAALDPVVEALSVAPAPVADAPSAEIGIEPVVIATPEPVVEALPIAPASVADAPSAEVVAEPVAEVVPELYVEALAPEPTVDAPSADLFAASADIAPAPDAAPLTKDVAAVAEPPHETPVETPAVEMAAVAEPQPEAVAEMPVLAEPVIDLSSDTVPPPEPAPPEAITEVLPPAPMPVAAAVEPPVPPAADEPAPPEPTAEALPPAPQPQRDLPTVKPPAAPAIGVKLPAPATTRRASTRRVTPAPEPIVAPAPVEIAAARMQEPAPAAPAEPPAALWTEGLAELKTLLTELRQRTQAPAPDSMIEALTPVAPPTFPGHAALPPEPFPELPAQLLATQDLPPEPHHDVPVDPPAAGEPPVAELPVAEPLALGDHEHRASEEHHNPHETVVANSLGNLIEDVLSRKSFSIAAVAAQQPRYGASEPMVEMPPTELDALLAAARTPEPVMVEPARRPNAATAPRRWIRLVDRVLAVVTVLMMVAGTYFGFSLLRDSSSEVQSRAITLPPAARHAGSPIWSTKPGSKDAGHATDPAAHRPGWTQAPAR